MSGKANALLNRFGANIAQTVAPRVGAAAGPAEAPPDRYAGAVKSRAFAELPLDSIVCDPQVREDFDPAELDLLARSIKQFGQLAPIRVRYDDERDAWVVLVGERRLRACRLAGLERIRVELIERPMSEADILAEQVVENVIRASLKPVEEARARKRLMEINGWTAEQLAETLGVESSSVYRNLGLLRLPDDVAAQVDAGKIKETAAYEISKLQIADDQRNLAERVISEGLDHKATVAEVAEVKRRRKRQSAGRGRSKATGKTRLPAEQRFRGSRGVRVVVHATGKHTLADVADDLREIASRLETQDSDAA
jgi:ParB family chromosome partitioning protein